MTNWANQPKVSNNFEVYDKMSLLVTRFGTLKDALVNLNEFSLDFHLIPNTAVVLSKRKKIMQILVSHSHGKLCSSSGEFDGHLRRSKPPTLHNCTF